MRSNVYPLENRTSVRFKWVENGVHFVFACTLAAKRKKNSIDLASDFLCAFFRVCKSFGLFLFYCINRTKTRSNLIEIKWPFLNLHG